MGKAGFFLKTKHIADSITSRIRQFHEISKTTSREVTIESIRNNARAIKSIHEVRRQFFVQNASKEAINDNLDDELVWWVADYDYEKYERVLMLSYEQFYRYLSRKLEKVEAEIRAYKK